MSVFATKMADLGPVGWWRLGETAGASVAIDSSSKNISGIYLNGPTLGVTGAIAGDGDTACQFHSVNSQKMLVPDHNIYSLTRGHDSFNRTVATGKSWGAAEHGGTWTAEVSTGSYYSVSGGTAYVNQTTTTGSYQQGLPITQQNADIQVQASWNQAAVGGALNPVALVARRLDNNNHYRAQLRENADHSLDLLLIKTVAGVTTTIGTKTGVGAYVVNTFWYVRFQLEDSTLRAKAWESGTPQPTTWMLTVTDTSITASNGNVSIRSQNSGSAAHPVVAFKDFRIQTLGLTVHVWMRPTNPSFHTSNPSGYIHFMGKGHAGQYEWHFRFYSLLANNTHAGWVSFYIFNLTKPPGAVANYGAGAAYTAGSPDMPVLERGKWYQFVATLDPGDYLDSLARVRIYKDGKEVPNEGGAFYENHDSEGLNWHIYPKNGSAPVNVGTEDDSDYFDGALDEVAIFSRKLTAEEIKSLYDAATNRS
jgi:hypothetical protein